MSRRKQNQSPWSLFAFQDIITSVTGIVIILTLFMALKIIIRPNYSPAEQSRQLVIDLREALEQTMLEIEELQKSVQMKASAVDIAAGMSASRIKQKDNETRRKIIQLEKEIQHLRRHEELIGDELAKWRSKNAEHDVIRNQLDDAREAITTIDGKLERLRNSQRIFYNLTGLSRKTAWLVDLSAGAILVAPYGKVQQPVNFQGTHHSSKFLKWASLRDPTTNHYVLIVRPASIPKFKIVRDRLDKEGFSLGFDLLGDDKTVIDSATGASL